jgi:tetratricopeptide (TPR) repeat protein
VARLLQMRGIARQELGEPGGLEDLRQALELALEHGFGFEAATSYTNLGEQIHLIEGPGSALALYEEGLAFADERGLTHHAWWTRNTIAVALFDLGRWDEALQLCDDVVEWDRSRGGSQIEVVAETTKAMILAFRGEIANVVSMLDSLLRKARAIEDVQALAPVLAIAAFVEERRGELDAARRLLEELHESTRVSPMWRIALLTYIARIGCALGEIGLAARSVDEVEQQATTTWATHSLVTAKAVLDEAQEELESATERYGDAAERWRTLGVVLEYALALLGLGRCHVRLTHFDEAGVTLAKARELFVALGAAPLIAEVDVLLNETTAAAS